MAQPRGPVDRVTWEAAAIPAARHLQRVDFFERVHLERILPENGLEGDNLPHEGVENFVVLRSGLSEVQLDRRSNPLVEDKPQLRAKSILVLE